MGAHAEYCLLSLPLGSSNVQLDCSSEARHPDVALEQKKQKKALSCQRTVIILLNAIILLLICTIVILGLNVKDLLKKIDESSSQKNCNVTENSRINHLTYELCIDFPNNNSHITNSKEKGCRLCPVGWKVAQDNCYLFPSHPETWHNSQAICRKMHSNLLTIESLEQKIFKENITPYQDFYWIGLYFDKETRNWVWADCDSCMTNFKNNLKHGEGGHNCGTVKLSENTYSSENCNSINYYICQKKAVQI
ncbi:CD209 antigen-like protein E [Hyperolius riggenbachi]|uniref:CD209 antigen-like protein E n=1 Tax=Hyperolius riggenbachi TaxID=752182 RepID=UPI0035A35830